MKNKELRVKVLSDGTFSQYRQERKHRAENGYLDKFIEDNVNNIEYIVCENIRQSCWEQVKKVKSHIEYWFNKASHIDKYILYFITFTFDDKAMSYKPKTRREHICRLLSKYADDYILNIDYGSENNREHYHSFVVFDKNKINCYKNTFNHTKIQELDNYKMGNYDLKKARINDLSAIKIGKYMDKLTLHSVKVKQSYISCKKGSLYQEYKKLNGYINELSKIKGINGLETRDKHLENVKKQLDINLTEENITLKRLKMMFGNDFEIIER